MSEKEGVASRVRGNLHEVSQGEDSNKKFSFC